MNIPVRELVCLVLWLWFLTLCVYLPCQPGPARRCGASWPAGAPGLAYSLPADAASPDTVFPSEALPNPGTNRKQSKASIFCFTVLQMLFLRWEIGWTQSEIFSYLIYLILKASLVSLNLSFLFDSPSDVVSPPPLSVVDVAVDCSLHFASDTSAPPVAASASAQLLTPATHIQYILFKTDNKTT